MEKTQNQNKSMPAHPFLALILILVIATIAANFIPSGEYTREVVKGRTIVNPESYKIVDKKYAGISDFFLSFYHGFGKAWGLIGMVLFVGGAFGVVKRIGLMETTIAVLAKKIKEKNIGFLPLAILIMTLFSFIVSFTGMWELSMVIVPFIIPLCLSLGYDVMVGSALIMLSACVSSAAALANPFFTAISHQIAELPIYSGMWYRAITTGIYLVICLIYILIYAKKVKNDPSKSILKDVNSEYTKLDSTDKNIAFTIPLIRAGIAFICIFIFLIYGTIEKNFSFAEMSAVFVAMAFIVGFANGSSLNEICYMFADGMKDLLLAGLVIFFARAILFVMEQTLVIDTIIHFLSRFFTGTNVYLTSTSIFLTQGLINFLIPSGSGQATITMPILIPLADMGGITRQVACYASQIADSLTNFVYPTNGSFVALLSIAGISYTKWMKFFAPLFAILMIVSIFLVMIAQAIKYGPF